jgi:hypothetical protein
MSVNRNVTVPVGGLATTLMSSLLPLIGHYSSGAFPGPSVYPASKSGGMLAMEYALTQPAGLASLILASSPASIPQWIAEANRLRKELHLLGEQTLRHHEEGDTTDEVAYEEAMQVYDQRHVCRLDPWPEPLMRTVANPEV